MMEEERGREMMKEGGGKTEKKTEKDGEMEIERGGDVGRGGRKKSKERKGESATFSI